MKIFVIYDHASAPASAHHKLAITLPAKWLELSVDKAASRPAATRGEPPARPHSACAAPADAGQGRLRRCVQQKVCRRTARRRQLCAPSPRPHARIPPPSGRQPRRSRPRRCGTTRPSRTRTCARCARSTSLPRRLRDASQPRPARGVRAVASRPLRRATVGRPSPTGARCGSSRTARRRRPGPAPRPGRAASGARSARDQPEMQPRSARDQPEIS